MFVEQSRQRLNSGKSCEGQSRHFVFRWVEAQKHITLFSLCSDCAASSSSEYAAYPLIELHPDSTFDHRGEATITHNEYSHLITRCWKYSSHNLAISQSNGSFLGANALNGAAIQNDHARGTAAKKKKKKAFPHQPLASRYVKQAENGTDVLRRWPKFDLPEVHSSADRKLQRWEREMAEHTPTCSVRLHGRSTAVLLCLCCCSTIHKILCVYFFTWWRKANEQALFPHIFYFFFLPSALTRWQSGVIDTSFSSFDFLQRQFNYSISPPKREEKDILSSTKP